ncbi:sensor histidine kinase [Mucilaginibacter gotjawali]|uniref:histidine kinase n=1 Tax=Mucilaginibacter gotjawali TaxID=1550579 RepID=A0A839SAC1_9SPHI|nr:ATP-binding protein [Mucilaginibacter gotjawali]MBB3054558.1 PAS domain S-box-containing protein [Mucilaginibacter gotjawali]
MNDKNTCGYQIINNSPELLCLFDRQLNVIMASNGVEKLYGFEKQALRGKHISEWFHSDNAGLLRKAIYEGNSTVFDNDFGGKSGLGGTVSWSASWMPEEEVMFCTGRKINTETVAVESDTLHSLEKSIERFEYVTEATTDIIWDWNLETNEVYYSGNIKKSFGHTPGINSGDMRFFAQHVHPDDRERVVLYADPVKYGSMTHWTEKYRFRKANGEYAIVLDKGIVIRDEKGVGIRMIGAMQDITELTNHENQIARQNEKLKEHANKLNTLNTLKDRLIAILAHDLRGPLSSLRGIFDLFQDDNISTHEMLNLIPSVVKKLNYTSDFLDTLLFWINTQMENFENAIRQFPVKEIITKEKSHLSEQAAQKDIKLILNVPEDIIAWADPDSIRIVTRNLITNAIKFSRKQSIIAVSVKKDHQFITISVKDNGIGMSTEECNKLFKAKVDSHIGTNNESGTGMGLLFCKDLVEKCKGTIWVDSVRDVGTEFCFTIPMANV